MANKTTGSGQWTNMGNVTTNPDGSYSDSKTYKQWSLIYDLLLLNKGASERTLDEIERDMDTLEFHCRKYADADDEELMA